MKQSNTKTNNIVLVICNKVVHQNAKIDWPDLNYPGTCQTILRTVHRVDYDQQKLQLDGEDGPWFNNKNFPDNVGFFKKL